MKIIILAGGMGSRMKQDIPKCACLINGKPMINYLLETCSLLKSDEIIVVVGYKKEEVKKVIKTKVTYIEQYSQLGTADAVKSCREYLGGYKGEILIIPGDTPLIPLDTLKELINVHKKEKNKLTILSTYMSNPTGYGRIKKENGEVTKIVEENETTELEKKINEVNTGIYCINSEELFKNINKIKNENNKKEYYLTDIVEYIEGKKNTYIIPYNFKIRGINDYQTLKEIEGILNS